MRYEKEREMRHQKKMNLTLWATSNLTKNLENKKGKLKNKIYKSCFQTEINYVLHRNYLLIILFS